MRHKPILFLLLFVIIFSCNSREDRKPTQEDVHQLVLNYNDSIVNLIDSMQKSNIILPPLYDKEAFDIATTNKFFELANRTNGELKLLVNSKLITNEIVNIIETHATDGCDILLLIDKTGSMYDDIDNVKKGLTQIVDALNKYDRIRLGIALYGDKNVDGNEWYSFKNFENDYTGAKNFINGIQVTMGGDYPESVYEGFFETVDQNFWKSENKQMIILIGDAPPLEKPLCKYSVEDVVKKANQGNITMNFYPIVVIPIIDGIGDAKEIKVYKEQNIINMIYPNPTSGSISVSFDRTSDYVIEIYNGSSELLYTENYSGDLWKRDLSVLANGIYVLRAIDKDSRFDTAKFIISK
jgi:hypothetical protein